jgi:hypothetical protein
LRGKATNIASRGSGAQLIPGLRNVTLVGQLPRCRPGCNLLFNDLLNIRNF